MDTFFGSEFPPYRRDSISTAQLAEKVRTTRRLAVEALRPQPQHNFLTVLYYHVADTQLIASLLHVVSSFFTLCFQTFAIYVIPSYETTEVRNRTTANFYFSSLEKHITHSSMHFNHDNSYAKLYVTYDVRYCAVGKAHAWYPHRSYERDTRNVLHGLAVIREGATTIISQ